MVDTCEVHFRNGYNAGVRYRNEWKAAAKLLFQALQKSRDRIRRLLYTVDSEREAHSETLAMYMAERDRILRENTKLRQKLAGR